MNKLHRVRFALAAWLLLLGAALLGGCRDKQSELAQAAKEAEAAAVIERYKVQGLAQLERIRQVSELVRDRPPLDADSRSLPFEKASFKKDGDSPPDGAFIDAGMLTEDGMMGRSFSKGITVDDRPFWGDCGAYLTVGKGGGGYTTPRDAAAVEQELRAFLNVKYLGVARTIELRPPEDVNEDEFKAGRYRFDMFFFELADPPKYMGGLRVDASNDPQVRFKYVQGASTSRRSYMLERLVQNLNYQTQSALYKLMNERAKGVIMDEPKDYGAVE